MEWIDKLLDKFESFFKRAFLPSMAFYFFFILFIYLFKDAFLEKITLIINEKNFIWIFIVFSIGLSYFLNMLHQLIFDNNIKKNYETKCFWTEENKVLRSLRQNVIKEIKNNEKFKNIDFDFNDYLLYQIILINKDMDIDTKRYVDEAKTYGIIFLSFILSSVVFLILIRDYLKIDEKWIVPICFYTLWGVICVFILICDAIKAKYRSRAIKIYLKYLSSLNDKNRGTD